MIFAAIAGFHLPLVPTMLVAAPVSIFLIDEGRRMNETLVALALIFTQLSLIAFGGGNTTLPEMHRQVVDVHHWMTGADFAALYALAQAAPGPNLMVAPLIGWQVAGLAGMLVTTVRDLRPVLDPDDYRAAAVAALQGQAVARRRAGGAGADLGRACRGERHHHRPHRRPRLDLRRDHRGEHRRAAALQGPSAVDAGDGRGGRLDRVRPIERFPFRWNRARTSVVPSADGRGSI